MGILDVFLSDVDLWKIKTIQDTPPAFLGYQLLSLLLKLIADMLLG